jgi:hypothetical protein
MLNDGFPPFALPIMRLVAPHLVPGAMVLTDNIGHFPRDHAEYLRYLRDPANGFRSGRLNVNGGTELSIKC